MDFNIDPLNGLNQGLNKANNMDTLTIEREKQMSLMIIQQHLRRYSELEQYQANIATTPMQSNPLPMAAMIAMGQDTPKGSNLFAPKPLPTNKGDINRMGRSHSMFTPSTTKAVAPLDEEKSDIQEKESQHGTENSDKKQLSDQTNARKRMNVFKCPHTDRKHYAKNKCNNCYHKQGRNKKATNCPHSDRQNYAKGKCQNCYLNDYHKVKRKMKKQQALKKANEDEVDRRISVETSSTENQQDAKDAPTTAQIN